MIFKKLNILFLSLLAAIMPLLSGCSEHADAPDYEGDLCLLLNVSVLGAENGTSRSISRAGDYDFELPQLQSEKLNTLRIIIVKNSTREIVHNYFQTLIQPTSTGIRDLKFQVEFSTDYTVYLIGNESGLVGVDTEQLLDRQLAATRIYPDNSPLENLQLNAPAPGQPFIDNTGATTTGIPLTEIFNLTTINRPQGAENLKIEMKKDMFLTRGASKFTFNFYRSADYTPGANTLQIRKVRISNLGTTQYAFPNATVYDPEKDTPSSNPHGGRIITEFAVPDGNETESFDFVIPEPVNMTSLPVIGSTRKVSYSPPQYFTETLGEGGFACSISFDDSTYLPPVILPNLETLPRNTHVIVNIVVGNNNAMFLTVVVQPWTPEYFEFDFTHNVGMAEDGTLLFTPETYASLDKSTGRLVLNDYPAAAIGTFGISEPKGAIWHAALITTAGEVNAIQFVTTDANGNQTFSPNISGIIDGKKTTFRVASTMTSGSVARTAKLQVMVTLLDGLSVPVNILKSTEYGAGVENITFIQNPQ